MTLKEIREANPFPWATEVGGLGVIRILDAKGAEVPLFTITALSEIVTAGIAAKHEAATATPT